MALLLSELYKSYKYLDQLKDERTQNLPLIDSQLYPIVILAAYFTFVLKIGPQWMRHRKAYNLKFILIPYNLFQIYISAWLVAQGFPRTLRFYDWKCAQLDSTINEDTIYNAYLFWVYFIVKVIDLFDTIFFVLKKNQRQITFLHLYHHGGMVLLAWFGCKFVPSGHGAYLGIINSLVHTVMYSYYLLTVIYPNLKKNLLLKKLITQMQIVQFAVLLFLFGQLPFRAACTFPKWISVVLTIQNFFITGLFLDFYYKAYIKKRKTA